MKPFYFFTAPLIITWALIAMAQSADLDTYALENETFKSQLLLDNCPNELNEAISGVIADYDSQRKDKSEGEVVAVLPKTIGFEYFTVELRLKRGSLVVPFEGPLYYQFKYWNEGDDDLCTRVEPEDWVY
jgi:hypothetical protein